MLQFKYRNEKTTLKNERETTMTPEKTIVAQRIERKFITCYTCKAVSTIDFRVVAWTPCDYQPVGIDYYRLDGLDGEEEVAVKNTYIPCCPQCGAKNIVRKELKKRKYSSKHVCDDRCQTATAEACTCSCEGKNHGVKNKLQKSLFF
jgi:hypothetical protein